MSSCPKPRKCAPSREAIPNAVMYEPEVIKDKYGKLLKQPDNPYVARVGRSELFYLDSTLPLEDALERKEQLDQLCWKTGCRLELDYDTFDAWYYHVDKKEVVFRFKNEYSRKFFAWHFNRGLETPVLEDVTTNPSRTVRYDLSKLQITTQSVPAQK